MGFDLGMVEPALSRDMRSRSPRVALAGASGGMPAGLSRRARLIGVNQ